ncbi:protein phosphatase [Aquimarina sp. TRL1]|uniref:fused DSP-PTPase phosphatase/NAD kinase-like protein n=1 Tax=Aquimarina sp. (strain TRL1) TaxID=2736252 RepID=UPI001588B9CF|nr:tyrosine-protein phosphatase [Aquimarina sp. TRL1]QKX04514.1 protein phosphatase [Aquimarina sp. TRL1]
MNVFKKIIFSLLATAILFTCYYTYHVHVEYRFTEIAKDRVYRSAAMPPDKITQYIKKHRIKTVIDLRIGSVSDPLNPSTDSSLHSEKTTIEKLDQVTYINIPSEQIPNDKNLKDFYRILDKEEAYPVLIHCHHGTGRAILYSALYRIEYENFTNEQARQKTRFPVLLSPFDHGTPKGEWLKKYASREQQKEKILANN